MKISVSISDTFHCIGELGAAFFSFLLRERGIGSGKRQRVAEMTLFAIYKLRLARRESFNKTTTTKNEWCLFGKSYALT